MSRRSLAPRARRLAADLDSALARARARQLDRDVDRDIGLALDRAYAVVRALAEDDSDSARSPEALITSLVLALSRARNLACARPSARNLVRTLNRALSRARSLRRDLAGSRYLVDLLIGLVHALAGLVHNRSSTPSDEQRPGPRSHRTRLGLAALALRVLPAEHRDRYRDEFRAELHELHSSWLRLRYGVRVLTRALPLRAVLRRTPPTPDGSPIQPER